MNLTRLDDEALAVLDAARLGYGGPEWLRPHLPCGKRHAAKLIRRVYSKLLAAARREERRYRKIARTSGQWAAVEACRQGGTLPDQYARTAVDTLRVYCGPYRPR